MQENLVVGENVITGTLKYLDEGELVDAWGAGNFMPLQFENIDPKATSVKVGMEPSYGSGLVEIINDEDGFGAWKITDPQEQVFKVVTTDGIKTVTKTYDLSALVCESN